MKTSGFPLMALSLAALFWSGCASVNNPAATATGGAIWRVDNLARIGGTKPEVLGAPQVTDTAEGKTLVFDGVRDGLIVPDNAITGWPQFTIEVLFNPAAEGAHEQRFFHIQESDTHRALLEIRMNPDGQWSLDAFLLDGTSSKALNDPAKLHPAGQWYRVALSYDGQHLRSYVNGQLEMEGEVTFRPMKTGQTSIGVRLNRVNWFKGAIREVRFTPTARQ